MVLVPFGISAQYFLINQDKYLDKQNSFLRNVAIFNVSILEKIDKILETKDSSYHSIRQWLQSKKLEDQEEKLIHIITKGNLTDETYILYYKKDYKEVYELVKNLDNEA